MQKKSIALDDNTAIHGRRYILFDWADSAEDNTIPECTYCFYLFIFIVYVEILMLGFLLNELSELPSLLVPLDSGLKFEFQKEICHSSSFLVRYLGLMNIKEFNKCQVIRTQITSIYYYQQFEQLLDNFLFGYVLYTFQVEKWKAKASCHQKQL